MKRKGLKKMSKSLDFGMLWTAERHTACQEELSKSTYGFTDFENTFIAPGCLLKTVVDNSANRPVKADPI